MALTDYLRASDGNGESVRCIVVDPRGIGDTAFNNTTPTNWPNTFVAMVGTVNTTTDRFEDGFLVFKGHLEGSVIRIDEFAPGYTDTGSPANDTIVIKPTTLWADIVADVAEQAASDAADALAGVTGKLDEDFTLLTPKTTPVDGDLFPINDSEDSNLPKSLDFENLKIELLKASMPVGIVITLGVSTNPNTLYGFGTWARIQGRVVVGVSDSDTDFDLDDTGGAKTHTLTANESGLRSHNHTQNPHNHARANSDANWYPGWGSRSGWGVQAVNGGGQGKIENVENTTATNNAVAASPALEPHNNLQPYIAKYVWQRTA